NRDKRVQNRPEKPQNRVLITDAQFADDERPKQFAVPPQFGEFPPHQPESLPNDSAGAIRPNSQAGLPAGKGQQSCAVLRFLASFWRRLGCKPNKRPKPGQDTGCGRTTTPKFKNFRTPILGCFPTSSARSPTSWSKVRSLPS